MAHRLSTADQAERMEMDYCYVNDLPVGNGADNKQVGDVQLGQLFLNDFYNRHPELFQKLPKLPRGKSQSILMDGKVGPQTIAGITEFQLYLVRGKGALGEFVDGRVSVPYSF